jgi:dihydrodipicolinate synthase/N-acetylneuraminate lyase
VDAYEVMHEWDRAVGNPERSDADLDQDVAARLPSGNYEAWKTLLEAGNVKAIKEGMRLWGLPIEPLKPFEVDDAIETVERTYDPITPD